MSSEPSTSEGATAPRMRSR